MVWVDLRSFMTFALIVWKIGHFKAQQEFPTFVIFQSFSTILSLYRSARVHSSWLYFSYIILSYFLKSEGFQYNKIFGDLFVDHF